MCPGWALCTRKCIFPYAAKHQRKCVISCLGGGGKSTASFPDGVEALVQAEAADCAVSLDRTAPRHSSVDEEKDDDTHKALAFQDTHSCEGCYEGNISATVLTRAAARDKRQPKPSHEELTGCFHTWNPQKWSLAKQLLVWGVRFYVSYSKQTDQASR